MYYKLGRFYPREHRSYSRRSDFNTEWHFMTADVGDYGFYSREDLLEKCRTEFPLGFGMDRVDEYRLKCLDLFGNVHLEIYGDRELFKIVECGSL